MRLRCGLFLLAVAVVAFVWRYAAPGWRHQVEIRPVGEQIRLYRHATGRVEILPLEEYVVGV
ncbi:MAG: stage II sporulation protein D, partial [Thermodesulfitimonas sp.]